MVGVMGMVGGKVKGEGSRSLGGGLFSIRWRGPSASCYAAQ